MNLNKKWWHRLVKVIFVVGIIFTISIIVISVIDEYKPHINVNKSTYKVACRDFDVTFGEFSGSITVSGRWLKSPGDEQARYLCSKPEAYTAFKSIQDEDQGLEFLSKKSLESTIDYNYKLETINKVINGSWLEFFIHLIISIILCFIGFSLIRYVYFYVITNKHKLVFNEFKKNK